MTGGSVRRATSLLLATMLAVVGVSLVHGAAYAADPKPCTGTEDATCLPSNSSSDSAHPATGSVSAGGERPNPDGGGSVLVTVSLPDPGVPVCTRGFGGAIVNAPCYANQFSFSKWNHVFGEFEDATGYAEVNGTSYDAALNAGDYRLFLLRDMVQLYFKDRPPVTQTIYGTYDRRSGAPAAPPAASFSYDVDEDDTIEFHATSTDPYDRAMTHQWDFGDGTTGAGPNPTHRYADSGNYLPKLTTTNSLNLSGSYSRLVIARGHPLDITALSLEPSSPVPLGDAAVAHVTVKNNGTRTITGITPTAELTPSDKVRQRAGQSAPFDLAGGASHSFDVAIETLAVGEATIRVRTPGTVQGSGTTAVAALSFDVGADPYTVTWATEPARPTPGDPFVLTANVKNSSGGVLHDVVPTLTLDPESGEQSAPNPARIVNLAQGGAGVDVRWTVSTKAASLHASLDLTGKDAQGAAVNGSSEKRVRIQHDIVVNEDGDDPIDPDALADDECDTDDDPSTSECTLRAAIQLANTRDDASITFDIEGAVVPVISPHSPLPAVTHGAEIDGSSQPGGWVRLRGNDAGDADGLVLDGRPAVVRGLVIGGFNGATTRWRAGIRVQGGAGHRIVGDRIGTDVSGLTADPNRYGVEVVGQGVSALIGGASGTTPGACTGDCNLLAGNTQWQVRSSESGAVATVQGNFVGLALDGSRALGGSGIWTFYGSTIGGPTGSAGTAPGNVVTGETGINLGEGVHAGPPLPVNGPPTVVAGNLVGLDPSGQRAVQSSSRSILNGPYGIAVDTAATVGGPHLADGNVVSGFLGDGSIPQEANGYGNTGIVVGVTPSTQVTIQHNRIGTNRDGTTAVPNQSGILNDRGRSRSGQRYALTVADNQISGNAGCGVEGGAQVVGNLIGTVADGSRALPNRCGLRDVETVGGVRPAGSTTCESPCNVISGNLEFAVATGFDNTVQGNFIGTDLTGTAAVPNGTDHSREPQLGPTSAVWGKEVGGISHAATTGLCDLACNLIAGNDVVGAGGLTVQGNVIGRDINGHALPNQGGVLLRYGGLAGASEAVIGGDGDLGNRIVDNLGPAVQSFDTRASPTNALLPFTRLEVRGNIVTGNSSGVDYYDIPRSDGGVWPFVVQPSVTAHGDDVHIAGVVAKGGETAGTRQVTMDVTAAAQCEQGQHGQLPVATGHVAVNNNLSAPFSINTHVAAGYRFLTVTATSRGFTSTPYCFPIEQAKATTTSNGPTAVGALRMEVASNDGFSPGDYVVVEPGTTHEETAHVSALGSLIFSAPLRFTHPAGASVWRIAAPGGDTAAPVISVSRPAAGATYGKGQRVVVAVRCSDSGVGIAVCAHARVLDTATTGAHTFVVRAVDDNGNTRTVQVPYAVDQTAVSPPSARAILLRALDPTPVVGSRARLVASVPGDVTGRYRIVLKVVGARSALKVCSKARRCAAWTPRRSGQASYAALLRSTGPRHRLLARSETVVVRWS